MRAIVHSKYGPPEVLTLAEVPQPTPAADELLVEVHAAGLNRTDTGFRSATPWFARFFTGLRAPRLRILGTEFAGIVTATGDDVDRFAVGDNVFGVRAHGFGTHAEYVCIKQTGPVARMPGSMSFIKGAGVCDGMSLAIGCLRRAKFAATHRILIYGSSGSIGTAAVQIAKRDGAHVTAVCRAEHVELMNQLGADEVIDYTTTDFARSGQLYDIIFDAVGKLSYWKCRRAMKQESVYVSTDLGFMWQNPLLGLASRFLPVEKKAFLPVPPYTQSNVELLKEMWEAGEYRAVIDRTYPLEDVVEATKYVESQQKTGNVVLVVR